MPRTLVSKLWKPCTNFTRKDRNDLDAQISLIGHIELERVSHQVGDGKKESVAIVSCSHAIPL